MAAFRRIRRVRRRRADSRYRTSFLYKVFGADCVIASHEGISFPGGAMMVYLVV